MSLLHTHTHTAPPPAPSGPSQLPASPGTCCHWLLPCLLNWRPVCRNVLCENAAWPLVSSRSVGGPGRSEPVDLVPCRHLDHHRLWEPNEFAVSCFRIIMYSIQVGPPGGGASASSYPLSGSLCPPQTPPFFSAVMVAAQTLLGPFNQSFVPEW